MPEREVLSVIQCMNMFQKLPLIYIKREALHAQPLEQCSVGKVSDATARILSYLPLGFVLELLSPRGLLVYLQFKPNSLPFDSRLYALKIMTLNKAANEEFYSCVCFDERLNKIWKENTRKKYYNGCKHFRV